MFAEREGPGSGGRAEPRNWLDNLITAIISLPRAPEDPFPVLRGRWMLSSVDAPPAQQSWGIVNEETSSVSS